MQQIISNATCLAFREFLSANSTLRKIEVAFSSGNVTPVVHAIEAGGERRSLVERYYTSLDLTTWEDCHKLIRVFENVLISAETEGLRTDQCRDALARDGFEWKDSSLRHVTGIAGITFLKGISMELDSNEMKQQLRRIEDSINADPGLAIGSAKDLVETVCRTILTSRNQTVKTDDMPQLVRETLKQLQLVPAAIPDSTKGSDTIGKVLGNLAHIASGLAELRNAYGSGHGKHARTKGLQPRHARLAVGAATTLVNFMLETDEAQRGALLLEDCPHCDGAGRGGIADAPCLYCNGAVGFRRR